MKFAPGFVFRIMLGVSLLAGLGTATAQDNSQPAAPDNTGVNQRDRDNAQPTADQQKDNQSDVEIAKQIRQSVMEDKSLSSYGHNVKIISQNGVVTLRGPVKSEDDKQSIAAKAAAVVGADKVTNELEVKPGN